MFKPWILGALRYEKLRIDGKSDLTQLVPNLTLLARANIRVSLEAFIQPSLDADPFRTFKANVLFAF